MNTEEKLKLLSDVRAAKGPLSTILWGKDRPTDAVPKSLHDDCMGVYAGLVMLDIRLVEEIGTDNL